MPALAISRPDASPRLLADWWLYARTSNTIRAIAVGALVAAFGALLGSQHDQNECRYGEPPHIEISEAPAPLPPIVTQIASPTFADLSNHCPGAVKFTTGDFKFR